MFDLTTIIAISRKIKAQLLDEYKATYPLPEKIRVTQQYRSVENTPLTPLELSILHHEMRYKELYIIVYKENYLTFSPRVLKNKKKEMTDVLEMIAFLTKTDFKLTKSRLNSLAQHDMTKPPRRH
jgi:hypothetical protein